MIEEAKEIFSLFDKVKIWARDLDFKRFPGWGLFHPNPGAGHCHESDGNISKGAPPPLSLFQALLSIIFLLNLFLPVSLQWYPGGGAAATEWNHRRGEFVSLTVSISVKKYCKVCDSLVTLCRSCGNSYFKVPNFDKLFLCGFSSWGAKILCEVS